MGTPNRELADISKASKSSVSYRPHEKCGTCGHFLSNGLCETVDGNVQSGNVCNLWTLIEARPFYNDNPKEFYKQEYARTNPS